MLLTSRRIDSEKSVGLKLPDWDRGLSDDQKEIIELDSNENHLICGSPGTGKTIMALYRAAKLSRDGSSVTILVYNRPLMLYMQAAIKGDSRFSNVDIKTYHSWLNDFYRKNLGKRVPQVENYVYKWDEVLEDFDIPYKIPHIIVDEAQDFPIELIRALTKVAKSVTCFIDPNQAIEAGKTDIYKQLKALCVKCPIELTENYRNSIPITELSRLYWNGEGTFAEPWKGAEGVTLPIMEKCRDYDVQNAKIADIIVKKYLGQSIGVLVNSKSLNNTYNSLRELLDGEVDVEMYKSQTSSRDIDFTKPGVKVLSFGTMKGLEFDVVIITRFEKMKATGDENADNNRAYVAITRAKRHLHIMYFGEKCTPGWANVMPQVLENRELLEWR